MKSIYDRNNYGIGESGPKVGESNPSDGDFFTNNGTSDSPFDTTRALKEDHLVKLMTDSVTSNNHTYLGSPGSITYQPSPNRSPFQDMNGSISDFGADFVNPETGNYNGRYLNPDNNSTF